MQGVCTGSCECAPTHGCEWRWSYPTRPQRLPPRRARHRCHRQRRRPFRPSARHPGAWCPSARPRSEVPSPARAPRVGGPVAGDAGHCGAAPHRADDGRRRRCGVVRGSKRKNPTCLVRVRALGSLLVPAWPEPHPTPPGLCLWLRWNRARLRPPSSRAEADLRRAWSLLVMPSIWPGVRMIGGVGGGARWLLGALEPSAAREGDTLAALQGSGIAALTVEGRLTRSDAADRAVLPRLSGAQLERSTGSLARGRPGHPVGPCVHSYGHPDRRDPAVGCHSSPAHRHAVEPGRQRALQYLLHHRTARLQRERFMPRRIRPRPACTPRTRRTPIPANELTTRSPGRQTQEGRAEALLRSPARRPPIESRPYGWQPGWRGIFLSGIGPSRAG